MTDNVLDPDDPDDLPPRQAAAAYAGLAENQNLYVPDRLGCALAANRLYEQWITDLRRQVEALSENYPQYWPYQQALTDVLDLIDAGGRDDTGD